MTNSASAKPRPPIEQADPAILRPTARERIAHTLLTVYKRALAPLLHVLIPTQCKYLPTCSDYAYTAVVRHGWLRGGWLALHRVARCHPWSKGGFDPVP